MTDYKSLETRADAFASRRNSFRLGEVLHRGTGVWARNLVPFTALSLVLHAPLLAWAAVLLAGDADPAAFQRFERWNGLALHVVSVLLSATVTFGVCTQLAGRRASMAAVVATGLHRFIPAAVVTVLSAVLTGLATLALIVPGLIVMCMLYVAVPAAVIEEPGIGGALRRSRELTAGNRPRIFGLVLLVLVGNAAATLIIHLVGFGFDPTTGHYIPISDLARSVVLGPLAAALMATTYALLRRQRDGVDASALAEVFA